MGTRGILGVHRDGKTKVAYNHFDSYPEYLGKHTIEEMAELLKDRAAFEALVKNWKEINPKKKPTKAQIEQCKPFTDLTVSDQSTDDWYCLTRKAQGSLKKMLECGFYDDSTHFAADSLFCEWGYIANLDNNTLEVYRGFQKEAHTTGLFHAMPYEKEHRAGSAQYYPVKLLGVVSFNRIMASVEDAYADMIALVPKEEDEEAA